jgi:hypothetical protein
MILSIQEFSSGNDSTSLYNGTTTEISMIRY